MPPELQFQTAISGEIIRANDRKVEGGGSAYVSVFRVAGVAECNNISSHFPVYCLSVITTETPKYKTMSVVTNTYKCFTSQYCEFVNICTRQKY